MKNLQLFILSIVFFFVLSLQIYTQTWQCGYTGTESEPLYIGTATHNVLVVYVDFADGRLPNGEVPQTDEELDLVQNLDAACFVGYDAQPLGDDPFYTWIRKVRKYTYLDCWNRVFSENVFLGNAHPDWISHGSHGFPKASDGSEGDTAKGFGSMKEYFKEVSYGKLTLEPYVVRNNVSPPYDRGILNNIYQSQTGVYYITPVLMPGNKSNYACSLAGCESFSVDIKQQVIQQLGFDVDTYVANPNNKIIYIYAGGSPSSLGGGTGHTGSFVVREKLLQNVHSDPTGRSVIDGISVMCHEYGHLLGWGHTVVGNYDIMNLGSDNQNCPSHPNMVFKLKAGWIDEDKILKINTNYSLTGLKPSILANQLNEKRCALVTIYGKAGEHANYNHTEQYILENRRMIWDNPDIKFDKKLVWKKNLVPPTPDGFNGGLLIYHYNANYTSFPFPPYIDQRGIWIKTNRELFFDPQYPELKVYVGDGDSRDFFGVTTSNPNPPIINELLAANTISSFNLTTGLQFTGITQPTNTNNINFNLNYTLGEPPQYNYVVVGVPGEPNPYDLNGRVFLHNIDGINVSHLLIQPGTIIDIPGKNITVTGNIKAVGTENSQIIFQGCAYAQYSTGFQGFKITNPTILGSVNETKFIYCRLEGLFGNTGYGIWLQTSQVIPLHPQVILENNYLSNNSIIFLNNNQNMIIGSIAQNQANVLMTSNQAIGTTVQGDISIPFGYRITFSTGQNPAYYFAANKSLTCFGELFAEGSGNSRITFNAANQNEKWLGINMSGGSSSLKYCDIKNSSNGINISLPGLTTIIDQCIFENNTFQDIIVNNFSGETAITISNSSFAGSRINYNIGLHNGISVNVMNNNFTNVNPIGIFVDNVTEPGIQENNITGSGTGIQGIFSYSSGGNYVCNIIQSCSNGLLLNNSSPYIYNNTIINNIKGIYLTNASSPVMTMSSDGAGTLINAGYNVIDNCTEEEIYCDNNSMLLPQSLPLLQGGKNAIYDNVNPGCLLNTNLSSTQLNAQENYWGEPPHPNAGDFCPQGTVDFSNWLTAIQSPPTSCNSLYITGGNSNQPPEMLLLSSANIDYFNGNYSSSISKYKNYITLVNNPSKSFLPLSKIYYATVLSNGDFADLENYYTSVGQQFASDTNFSHKSFSFSTASDVLQHSFGEAINEYEQVIVTSQNPAEVHYAYVDKMRTVRLMLDSLLRGMNGGNGPQGGSNNSGLVDLEKIINDFINYQPEVLNKRKTDIYTHSDKLLNSADEKANLNNSKSEQSNIENTYSDRKDFADNNILRSKHKLNSERIDLRNKTKREIAQIIDNAITFKIIEYTLLNHTSFAEIPKVNNMDGEIDNGMPRIFKLHQNYPNPFNPLSTIKYDIPKQSIVRIVIFDLLGREVKTLVNEAKDAGYHEALFDGTNYASGLYFYRIEAGSFSDVKKMVLIK